MYGIADCSVFRDSAVSRYNEMWKIPKITFLYLVSVFDFPSGFTELKNTAEEDENKNTKLVLCTVLVPGCLTLTM